MPDSDTVNELVAHARQHYQAFGFDTQECAVADLLVTGMTTTTAISRALGITDQTVRNVMHRMFRKAGVHTRVQLVIRLVIVAPSAVDDVDPFVTGDTVLSD